MDRAEIYQHYRPRLLVDFLSIVPISLICWLANYLQSDKSMSYPAAIAYTRLLYLLRLRDLDEMIRMRYIPLSMYSHLGIAHLLDNLERLWRIFVVVWYVCQNITLCIVYYSFFAVLDNISLSCYSLDA